MALRRLAWMLLFAVILPAQPADGVGVIRGSVLYADGAPVNEARVLAGIPGAPQGGIARYVHTDQQGNFVIDSLRFGAYAVYASKEDEGYGDPRFFPGISLPRVTLSAEQPLGSVDVILGAKAGTITGMVRDAVTGKPLPAGLSVREPGTSWFHSSSQGAHYRLLLPTRKDLTLEVSSPGYQTWTYGERFQLEPGSEWKLDIKLTPQPDSTRLTKILIPEGYRGQVRLQCGLEGPPAMSQEDGRMVYRIGRGGILQTSSPCPEMGSDNHHYYYETANGVSRAIAEDYWHGNGLIFEERAATGGGKTFEFGFFVGTEEEYRKIMPDRFSIL